VAFPERDRDSRHVGIKFKHLFRQCFIFSSIKLAGFNININADAERFLAILFIGNADIDMFDQFAHHFRRAFAIFPKFAAEIEIA